ncbi:MULTISPECIES: lectin OAA family protein [Nostocales]|uniref:Lectin OAA n=3 Tax=Nostocales TaxID=1161 RepID=A0A8S9TF88_9CYAN|nr:lectin OAA [Tolypothrix bouteillei]KAF3890169.1 lectin OAA [Tolypothrix bouteillei VB521301]
MYFNPPNDPPAQPVSQVFHLSNGNRYQVTHQWGGSFAPWQDGGTWVIGSRTDQHVVAIDIKSNDGGQTLNGTITYSGEGPIGFWATQFGSNNDYKVETQWGGDAAPWNDGGTWVIGSRTDQHVVAIDVQSNDGGQTLNGTITYSGEGPISFKGQRERI